VRKRIGCVREPEALAARWLSARALATDRSPHLRRRRAASGHREQFQRSHEWREGALGCCGRKCKIARSVMSVFVTQTPFGLGENDGCCESSRRRVERTMPSTADVSTRCAAFGSSPRNSSAAPSHVSAHS